MYPGTFARTAPNRPAVIGDDGEVISYRILDERSNQFAHYLRSIGIGGDDVVAVLMNNNVRFYEVAWGARRSGIAFTTINYELEPDAIAHIVRQSAYVGRRLPWGTEPRWHVGAHRVLAGRADVGVANGGR